MNDAILTIDSLAFGGNGVGRLDGKAVFVPLTAPGDRVRCRIVRDKGRWAEGELLEIMQPAVGRCQPCCPVFGRCGGCQWQHLPYADQCQWKERIFHDLLLRQAKAEVGVLRPLVVAPRPFGYRSRVQFKCRLGRDGLVIGFYRRGSHYVENIESCPLAPQAINQLIFPLRRTLELSGAADRVPQVDVAVDDLGGCRAVVHCLVGDNEKLRRGLTELGAQFGIAVYLQCGRKESLTELQGPEELTILCDEPPLTLGYGPGGFAQVNLEQNRALVTAVLSAARLNGSEQILDLFCGMGNFSLPLARRCRNVTGVEDYAPAIARAARNAVRNGLNNCTFLARSAAGALSQLAVNVPFDLVLLDPPREGAYEVSRELLSVRPRQVLYVSCDPTTLCRDLTPLLHNGYRLVSSQPFDFFPQTHHVESLTVLEWIGQG